MNKQLGAGKTVDVKCTQTIIPAFPSLLFGTHFDLSYFDATSYLQQSESKLSVNNFFKHFEYQIQMLADFYGLSSEQTPLVVLNTEGHYLINGCLSYLFLVYVEPQFCGYCNDIINNVMTTGVAVSDTHLVDFIKQRFSPDNITQIWANGAKMESGKARTDIQQS